MLKKLLSLFEALSEPVIAAEDGEIIYRNTAANNTEAFKNASICELLPGYARETEADGSITETVIEGLKYVITVTILEETKIYVFRPMNSDVEKRETDILSAVSTSLREPLSVMSLAAGQLLPFAEQNGDERISEYVSMIHRSIFSVMRALNRLDALRFLAGETPTGVERRAVDLALLTEELAASVEQVLELERGRLRVTSDREIVEIMGDKRLIERMLLNLIGNALIFSPDDTKIKIAVKKSGDRAIISVSDDGDGIAGNARYDIWSRFGAKREPTDTKSGSGFGLSMVQAIARMHGGGAVIESVPGSGTTVMISLAAKPDGDVVPVFDAPAGYSTVNDMREIFTELVNIIPKKKFSEKYMD